MLLSKFFFLVHPDFVLPYLRQAQDDSLDPEEKKKGFMGRFNNMKVRFFPF